LYLPSLKSESVRLALAIDTSGSISDDQLQQFISEVQAILDLNLMVTIYYMECDAEIHKVFELHSRDDVLRVVGKLTGRGGTDFRPVFREIERDGLDIEGLIFLSDGDGTYPAKAPEYKVMWILTQDWKVPFGEVAIMEVD
jgi:predicted metal-dependent peptidase